jgi:hypothetical protein
MNSCNFYIGVWAKEISEKVQKSLITRIRNALKNKEKSVESFFEICVIRERKVVFQSSLKKYLTWGEIFNIIDIIWQ